MICVAYLRQQIKGHLRVDSPFFRLKEHTKYRSVMVTASGSFIAVTSIEVNRSNPDIIRRIIHYGSVFIDNRY